jgi:norsolorinic acid ketoreductase
MSSPEPKTYLITGANRGIGRQLTTLLLSRPNTTVIAANRDPSHPTSTSLSALPTAPGSSLIVLKLDASIPEDASAAYTALTTAHPTIKSIDVLLANAGIIHSFGPALTTPPSVLTSHFNINTLAPLYLLQAFSPLLLASPSPKFAIISTNVASLSIMEKVPFPALSYGISKIAGNYLVRKLHFENEKLTTLALHPGWVKTDMGHFAATQNGMKEDDVPVTVEESASGLLKVLDEATKDNMSGEFVGYDGVVIPY